MTDPLITPTATTGATVKASTWEDVLDIFYAPREVFERRRDGRYLVPMLVLCVVTVVVFFLSQQMNEALQDAEFARVVRENNLAPEAARSAREMGRKFGQLAIYFVPVLVAIGAWIGGLILLVVGKMMGAKLTYAQAVTIAVLATMPEMLGRIMVGVQSMFIDTSTAAHRYSFSISASRFVPGDANNWLLKLGALVDPFVIWGIVLTGVGAYVIGRMEKEKAAVLAIVTALAGAALFR